MSTETMYNFSLGHNGYVSPFVLPAGSFARGVNVSVRGGLLKTRPRLRRICQLADGRWQGAFSSKHFSAFVIGGVVQRFKHRLSAVETVSEVTRNAYAPRCWGCDVNGTLLINDAKDKPVLVGLTSARKLGEGELPVGSVCAFGQGRIFFADRFQRTLQAGDIDSSSDTTNVFKYTEYYSLNEGLFIQQPASSGLIRGLAFVRNYQTGTGLGQLISLSDFAVNAYNVFPDRASWFADDNQIGQQLFVLPSCGGTEATIQTNNDLFFRSEFIRTIRNTTTEASSGLQNLPLTIALYDVLTRDSGEILHHVSGALHNNHVLYTAGAHVDSLDGTVYFDSLVSLDLASYISGGSAQITPDGFWTGHRFLHVFSVSGRTYVVTRDTDGTNYLNEITETERLDPGDTPVRSRMYSPRFGFESAYNVKDFEYAEVWLSDIRVDTDVTVYFRGDDPCWTPTRTHPVTIGAYPIAGADYDVLSQVRRKIRLPALDADSAVVLKPSNSGTTFQFCLEFTGNCQVERVLFSCSDPKDGDELVCDDFVSAEWTLGDNQVTLYDYD